MTLTKEELRSKLSSGLDIEDFTPEEQKEIVEKLGDFIVRRAYAAILEELTEQEKEELKALMNTSTRDEVLAFIFKKVPHVGLLVKDAATQTIEEFKSLRS